MFDDLILKTESAIRDKIVERTHQAILDLYKQIEGQEEIKCAQCGKVFKAAEARAKVIPKSDVVLQVPRSTDIEVKLGLVCKTCQEKLP